MNSKEQREQQKRQQEAVNTAQELLRTVIRMFYEPKHAVVLDYIIRLQCIADDALAERLHCQLKDCHRILAVLRDDKFVKIESRQEPTTNTTATGKPAQGPTRMYSFVDYKLACKAIKWRLERMREASESRLRADLERKGYKCGQCGRRWSPLDVQSLPVSSDGFVCDNCDLTVIIDDEEELSVTVKKRPQELHVQLMETVAPLVQLLKRIDINMLPVVKFGDYVAHIKGGIATIINNEEKAGKELKGPSTLELGVSVELDGDQVDPKQPELPVWHTHSTVTGEKLSDKHHLESEDGGPIKKSRSVEIVFDDFDDIPTTTAPTNQELQVMVRGVPKPFTAVTEDDKRMMTSEEYEVYFEHYLRIQGQE